jgi:hypothetical protein
MGGLQASNITLSNIILTKPNTTDDFVMVHINLNWENSWRASNLNSDGLRRLYPRHHQQHGRDHLLRR